MKTRVIRNLVIIFIIPVIVLLGITVFSDRQYAFISLAVAMLACVPFFMDFEKKSGANTKKLIILAVMVALSVLGRFLFILIPFFKPVTAVIVITAIYFGSETGFLCGALSAFLSNFYFGQGPWTPFQMLVWGLIGFVAGLLAENLKKNPLSLVLFGILAGVTYSLVMDVWAVLWIDGVFNLPRYIAALVTGLPVTAVYAVSNVFFLLPVMIMIGPKLQRIKTKYGL
jgi:uncharacterized membrane protein